jgi:hypothetical protein
MALDGFGLDTHALSLIVALFAVLFAVLAPAPADA